METNVLAVAKTNYQGLGDGTMQTGEIGTMRRAQVASRRRWVDTCKLDHAVRMSLGHIHDIGAVLSWGTGVSILVDKHDKGNYIGYYRQDTSWGTLCLVVASSLLQCVAWLPLTG